MVAGEKCKKTYGSPAWLNIVRKFDLNLIRKTEPNSICKGNNVSYYVEGYAEGARFEWSSNNVLSLSSGQGTRNVTFTGINWGEAEVQVKVSLGNNLNTTLTASDVWVGIPKTPLIDGFSTDGIEFKPNSLYYFSVKSPHFSANNYSWAIEGGTIIARSDQWIQVRTDKFIGERDKQFFSINLNATNRCGTNGVARNGYIVFGPSVITRSGNSLAENLNVNSIKSLRIYSLNGMIVYSSNNHIKFNINNIGLKSGIYIIETTDNENIVKREKIFIK